MVDTGAGYPREALWRGAGRLLKDQGRLFGQYRGPDDLLPGEVYY